MKEANELASGAREINAKLDTWASAGNGSNETSSSVCRCDEQHGDGLQLRQGLIEGMCAFFFIRSLFIKSCRVCVVGILP